MMGMAYPTEVLRHARYEITPHECKHHFVGGRIGPTGRKRWMIRVKMCHACGDVSEILHDNPTWEQREWVRRRNLHIARERAGA